MKHLYIDCIGIVGQYMHQGSVWHIGRCAPLVENWTILGRCARAGDCMVHEVEVEMSQEEGEVEGVSINLVYLNNKQSLITTQLEMQVNENTIKDPIQDGQQ